MKHLALELACAVHGATVTSIRKYLALAIFLVL